MKRIIEIPETNNVGACNGGGYRDGDCEDCNFLKWVKRESGNNESKCPILNGKEIKKVKIYTSPELGVTVKDEDGIFHCEGGHTYYSTENK